MSIQVLISLLMGAAEIYKQFAPDKAKEIEQIEAAIETLAKVGGNVAEIVALWRAGTLTTEQCKAKLAESKDKLELMTPDEIHRRIFGEVNS